MSIIIPPRTEATEPTSPMTTGYDPARGGCTFTGCRSQDTTTLCGRFGRRCDEHSPWRTHAAEGRDGLAYWSLRVHLNGRTA